MHNLEVSAPLPCWTLKEVQEALNHKYEEHEACTVCTGAKDVDCSLQLLGEIILIVAGLINCSRNLDNCYL